jgi:hypothetical protein
MVPEGLLGRSGFVQVRETLQTRFLGLRIVGGCSEVDVPLRHAALAGDCGKSLLLTGCASLHTCLAIRYICFTRCLPGCVLTDRYANSLVDVVLDCGLRSCIRSSLAVVMVSFCLGFCKPAETRSLRLLQPNTTWACPQRNSFQASGASRR